jgi:hypothetical protein
MNQEKQNKIIDIITRFGDIDGVHHKQWILDQIVRILLTPDEYLKWKKEMKGEYDELNDEYEYEDWDEGIAP